MELNGVFQGRSQFSRPQSQVTFSYISFGIAQFSRPQSEVSFSYIARKISFIEATEPSIFLLYFKEDLRSRGHIAKYLSPILQGRSQFSRPQSEVSFSYISRKISVLEATKPSIFLLYFKEDLNSRGHRAKYFSPIFQGRSLFSRPQSQVFFSYISRKISVLEDTERRIILAEDRSPIYIFWNSSVLDATERRFFLLYFMEDLSSRG